MTNAHVHITYSVLLLLFIAFILFGSDLSSNLLHSRLGLGFSRGQRILNQEEYKQEEERKPTGGFNNYEGGFDS